MSIANKVIVFALIFFISIRIALAGTSGNLSGKVTDISSGEALPGVNVQIIGSGRGGATNAKGEFLVAGIVPGKYSLRVSALGYKPVEVKNVTIEVDETTVYNLKLASEDIELEGITVEGKRPLIDVKKTSSDQTFNRDKIDQLPNLKGVEDVLTRQAGVTKFGGQIFLRGGRANETQIMVDGVVISRVGSGGVSGDEANDQLRELYSGAGTTNAGVSADAIASVSTSTSGLDAEYGNAQSGVINIVTKSGSEKYSGSGQYRTDSFVKSASFGERFFAASFSGPEPLTAHLLPALGVEIPGKLGFFTNASFTQREGPHSFSTGSFYNPLRRKVRFGGFLGSLLSGLGFTFSDRQSNEFTYNLKLSYVPGGVDRFAFSYRVNLISRHPFSSSYFNRDRYDSTVSDLNADAFHTLQWTHLFGTNTQMRLLADRQETRWDRGIGNLTPPEYSSVTSLIGSTLDPYYDGFRDLGSGQEWFRRNLVVWKAKLAFESQVHQLHFLKTGFEFTYEHWEETQLTYPLSPARSTDSTLGGLYRGYGLGRWVSNNFPSFGGIWIQDNIDFPGINIKIGLRYDFYYLGKQVFDPAFVKLYESVINDKDPLTPFVKAEWLDKNSFWSQFKSGEFSPRLAINYPISERANFFFSYGQYRQFPERFDFFHAPLYDSTAQLATGRNYVGNPALRPQKTASYEAGFKQLIFEDLSLQLTGFYKDIFDLISSQNLELSGRKVSRRVNLDYASVRGFEVIVEKGVADHWSGNVNYSFQLAKGRTSNPFATQVNPLLAQLPREVPTDYDVRHRINLILGFDVKPNEDFELLGIPLSNFGVTVLWAFASGSPYTPYNLGKTIQDAYLANTGSGPYTSQFDLSVRKGFSFLDGLNLLFSVDVTNLFNRKNIDMSFKSQGLNTVTGAPSVFGDGDPSNRNLINSWGGSVGSGSSFAGQVSPYLFGEPRQINFGLKLQWN